MHIRFCRHIWAELSLLFLTFLSGTFFPRWGGGGGEVHVHPNCVCTRVFAFLIACEWHTKNAFNTSDSTILWPSFESVKFHLAFWNWARVILTSPLPIYVRTKALCSTSISLLIVIALDRMDIYTVVSDWLVSVLCLVKQWFWPIRSDYIYPCDSTGFETRYRALIRRPCKPTD